MDMKRKLLYLFSGCLITLLLTLTACNSTKQEETKPTDITPSPSITPETPAPGNVDYSALGWTEDEIRLWEERGVAYADSAEVASLIAGFEVHHPAYIPDDFSSGEFAVLLSGAGMPEEFKPKFNNTQVHQSFTWQEDRRVVVFLIYAVHPTGLGGVEPADICGYQGERSFTEADPDNDNRPYAMLSLAWGANGRYYILTGTLGGPLDEETIEKIACSITTD